jgi:hypothetical protein
MSVDEWNAAKIRERAERTESTIASTKERDPQGAYPMCARLEQRRDEFRRRLAAKDAPPASSH